MALPFTCSSVLYIMWLVLLFVIFIAACLSESLQVIICVVYLAGVSTANHVVCAGIRLLAVALNCWELFRCFVGSLWRWLCLHLWPGCPNTLFKEGISVERVGSEQGSGHSGVTSSPRARKSRRGKRGKGRNK